MNDEIVINLVYAEQFKITFVFLLSITTYDKCITGVHCLKLWLIGNKIDVLLACIVLSCG
jgi:hypothetical protein